MTLFAGGLFRIAAWPAPRMQDRNGQIGPIADRCGVAAQTGLAIGAPAVLKQDPWL